MSANYRIELLPSPLSPIVFGYFRIRSPDGWTTQLYESPLSCLEAGTVH